MSRMVQAQQLRRPIHKMTQYLSGKSNTTTNTVHILGVGAIGGLIAHELTTIKHKPVITLLFRDKARTLQFEQDQQSTIHLKRIFCFPPKSSSATFSASTALDLRENIQNLIICTKTYQTYDAIKPYLSFITPQTNILLIQNGLGVIDELYERVWPHLEDRPHIWQGVINHGVFVSSDSNKYEINHSGDANFFIGKVPQSSLQVQNEEKCEMQQIIQQLKEAIVLKTSVLEYDDLLLFQLQKLMVNACINPNTSIINCANGELAASETTRSLFYDIISESVDIFKATIPSLKKNTKTELILNKERLLEVVMDVGTVVNGKTSSSMRQDVVNLRNTEIDYINGYVVSLAEKNGRKADINKAITKLVKIRLDINRANVNNK